MIAIQRDIEGWGDSWISFCESENIPFKVVDSYKSDIIDQLEDCEVFMWHHYHLSSKDTLFAKQLLYTLEMSGRIVFPDFRTNWHFDDKLGQKYLLESISAPVVPSYVFYTRKDAINWIKEVSFPKVFKLRGGSSSANVKLVRSRRKAFRLIAKAFGRGYSQYNAMQSLRDRMMHYKKGKVKIIEVMKGLVRLIVPTPYSRIRARERGYIYFQDFIPDNSYDIRVTYVFNRCFALRRKVRSGDFRASGSGIIEYDMSQIPKEAIKIAFLVANRLKLQSAAFDFVLHNGNPLIVEMSYGFGHDVDQFNHGFWESDLTFSPGTFNPYGWMVEGMM